jgi:23S rRNA pseudouridine2605 synthase
MRLAKHLAHAGVASRRGAEALIAQGRVTVDGKRAADPARDVTGQETIVVDGRTLSGPEARVVLAVNKPPGIVSTARDPQGRMTVVELAEDVAHGARLYPVGRLDADSTGLILLTNDGDLANHLTHPRYEVPKVYRVRVAGGRLSEPAMRQLREGVQLEDGRTAPATVRQVSGDVLELTIHEGRKRQVKRMCEAVGHRVLTLQRVAFGPLPLGRLPLGAVRRLSPAEVERLRAAARPPQPA